MQLRRTLLASVAAAAALSALAPAVFAADAVYPSRPIRLIVPFGAGGSTDMVARLLAEKMGPILGQAVVIENKGGAGGSIGASEIAKSAPDAATLLLTSSTFLTTAATQSTVPYDPVGSFAPAAMVAQGPMLLAVPALGPVRTAADRVAAARRHPGALNYGSAGVGSIGQMATELFSGITKIQMTHVPYKGAANALVDLASGQIGVMISNYSSLVSQIKGGKVRAIAVTSQEPSPAFPGLPPLASVAPGYAIDIWVSVFAPAGTPPARLERLNREIAESAKAPEVRQFLDADGAGDSLAGDERGRLLHQGEALR